MKKFYFLFTLAFMLVGKMGMGQTAYITNHYANYNTVSVIDIATHLVPADILVGANPYGVSVSPDGTKVYITNSGDSTVSVINTATNTVSATITVGQLPTGIVVSRDGSKGYVADGGGVTVINTANHAVTAKIATGRPCCGFTLGLALSSNGNKLYVSNYYDTTVTVINTATNTISATITVGTNPFGVAVTPDGSKVYVANNLDGTVSVINGITDTVLTTIAAGFFGAPEGVSASPDGSKVYVANDQYPGWVSVINTAADTVSDKIYVGYASYGISVSPDGSKVLVANWGDNSVSELNTYDNSHSWVYAVDSNPIAFGNFISTYPDTCRANFSIAADTSQLHHYIVTDSSHGKKPFKYVWSWGDGSYDTIPYPSHTYADPGFYSICLSITDSMGCQSSFCDSSFHALRTTNTMVYVDVFNPLTTNVKYLNAINLSVNIYPNPLTSQTTISFDEEQKNTIIEITDILGREIRKINFTGKQLILQCKEMSKGIYLVRVTDDKKNIINKKIIVE